MKKVYRVKAVGTKDGMVIGIEQNVLANGHDNSIIKHIQGSGLEEIWSISAKLNLKETLKAYSNFIIDKLFGK